MRNKNFKVLFQQNFIRLFTVLLLFSIGANGIGFAQVNPDLSSKDKLQIFDKVWNLVNTRYYDPNMNGVNWVNMRDEFRPLVAKTEDDMEFYDLVKKMVGKMNDAHTRFLTPREAKERRVRRNTTAGVLLSNVEGKTVIEKVSSKAEGDLAKIKPGMFVRTIDGISIKEKIKQAKKELGNSSSARALQIMIYSRVMRGEPDTTVKLGLTDKNGKNFEVTLQRKIVPEKSEAITKRLDSNIGYIRVTSFKYPIAFKFRKALLELKDTSGLIIDLRYNGGGSISEVLRMASYLLNERKTFGKFIMRLSESKQTERKFSAGRKNGQIYSKPVVVLTNKFSASGSELFSSSLQEFGRVKVIGRQTCGCLLGISKKHRMQGGSELHISDIGFLSAKGKIYEKIGVTPDKVIGLQIKDLQNNFDRGMSEANKMLKKMIRK